jgi:hypothetical protein
VEEGGGYSDRNHVALDELAQVNTGVEVSRHQIEAHPFVVVMSRTTSGYLRADWPSLGALI